MAININGKTIRNLQQQVLQNMNDIAEIKESGITGYTAGTGIDITEDVISVDTDVIATKSDITEVVANPQIGELDNPTQLENLQVGENKYWIPTDTSDLTNDSGFITIADVPTPVAGFGIDITNATISVDNTVALKIDLPHLYQHNIVGMSSDTQDFVLFSFINTTSTPMTFGQVREWLYDNGFTGEEMDGKHYLPATGRCSADSFEFDYTPQGQATDNDYCESVVVGVRATNEDDNYIKVLVSILKEKDSQSDAYEEDYIGMSDSFTDTVITLC